MRATANKTALITGCSDGGLGAALARCLHKKGFRVFATVREPSKAKSLQQESIEVLLLDVTSQDSIHSCAELVRSKTGGTLDLLINNAGSIYNSSKAAETWFSETLRIELEPLGVRVLTAMVGEVETNIYQTGQSFQLPKTSYYKAVEHRIAEQAAGRMQERNEPADITARNLVADVLSGRSGFTWRGGVAGTAKLASWLLPTRLFEKILHSGRGVYDVKPPQ